MPTWSEQFYPVPAEVVADTGGLKECLEHSIKKWEGLAMLKPPDSGNHCVTLPDGTLFKVDCTTCALCAFCSTKTGRIECEYCPVSEVYERDCEKEYKQYIRGGDPKPMLDLLKKARAYVADD
jgi:hypothetical protein